MTRTKIPAVGVQIDVPIAKLDEETTQPRNQFDEAALNGLADTIREHGVKVALQVVALANGRFLVKDGARRRRAAVIAGLETLPVIVVAQQNGLVTLRDQMLANAQREDLPPQDDAASMLIYWLGRNIEAFGDDGNPPEGATVSERIAVLTARLCQAANVATLDAYTSSGKIAVPWKQILLGMGRGSWSDDRRKQHIRRIKGLDAAVLDAIIGVPMSAQTVKDLSALPADQQQAVLDQARADGTATATLGDGLRAALDDHAGQHGGSDDTPPRQTRTRANGPDEAGDLDDDDAALVDSAAGGQAHGSAFEPDPALALLTGPSGTASRLITDQAAPQRGSTPPEGHGYWDASQVLVLHAGFEGLLTTLEDTAGQVLAPAQVETLKPLWDEISRRARHIGI